MKDMKEKFDKILYSKTPDFNEEEHEYTKNDKVFTSVTSFISEFFPKFDQERISQLVANKRVREGEDITAEEVIKEWNDIRDNGTNVHKEIENAILSSDINPERYEGATQQGLIALKGLESLHNYVLYYPELQIYDEDSMLAGTIDLVAITASGKVHLIDWKTNTKIRKHNDFEKGSHEITKDLDNSSLNKYKLQLNVYKYLFERLGENVENMAIIHIRPQYFKVYEADDCGDMVKNLLEVKNG